MQAAPSTRSAKIALVAGRVRASVLRKDVFRHVDTAATGPVRPMPVRSARAGPEPTGQGSPGKHADVADGNCTNLPAAA